MGFYNKYIRPINHKQIAATRALALNIIRMLFDRGRFSNSGQDILILRLDDKLGDSICSTGFLAAVKQQYPNEKLIVLSSPVTAQVYESMSVVDRVYRVKKGIIGTLSIYLQLLPVNLRNPFRWIITNTTLIEPRTLFLTAKLLAKEKIGFQCQKYKSFSKSVLFDENKEHIVSRYQRTLVAMGLRSEDLHYQVFIPQDVQKQVAEIVQRSLSVAQEIIILNSFAGSGFRSFNRQTTFKLVDQFLMSSNVVVISIAGPRDMETLRAWHSQHNNPRWLIFPHLSNYFENLALVNLGSVVVTPDTAVVHMASALRKNLVAIFRQDSEQIRNSEIWAPYGTKYRIVIAPIARPEEPDINSVPINEVINAWRDLQLKS